MIRLHLSRAASSNRLSEHGRPGVARKREDFKAKGVKPQAKASMAYQEEIDWGSRVGKWYLRPYVFANGCPYTPAAMGVDECQYLNTRSQRHRPYGRYNVAIRREDVHPRVGRARTLVKPRPVSYTHLRAHETEADL
eukprot:3669629-Amphidinium_carterae.1